MADINDTFAPFNFPEGEKSIIKVIGVGGGGGNAVNHMYNEGIHDVSFVVCNTDKKALNDSPVPVKLQLGEGLGAGNKPEKARKACEDSIDEIHRMLDDGTKMVFITAGMGGGTGTGASPIIAKVAKDMGILTVGIVTIPFRWEGKKKIDQALDGVEQIKENVDALLVVNNERLRKIYPDYSVDNAFAKADDTLCNAAKSISEIITMHGKINLDFQDVTTVLKDGGVAIMSTGYGTGENRVTKAIDDALHSPLLNDNDIYHAHKVLLHIIHSGDDVEGGCPLMMDEINEINDFMEQIQCDDVETKWGYSKDPSLKDRLKITILATGFGLRDINSIELDEARSKRDAKTQQEEAEEDARRQEREERRQTYYGSDSKTGRQFRAIHSYIFRDEDLDNDNLISMIETSPTYRRTKEKLRTFTQAAAPVQPEPVAPQPGQTITFATGG